MERLLGELGVRCPPQGTAVATLDISNETGAKATTSGWF